MYRARVESVSGKKVFADGKWLTCIGNKHVSVGEYIWTDGRCVYGNNQISHQPLIITAPQDEKAMPILMHMYKKAYSPKTNYYLAQCNFRKNRLEYIGETETDIVFGGNHEFNVLMVNDTAGNVFIYEENPVLIDTGTDDNGRSYSIFEKLVACNVSNGNHYYMVLNYAQYHNKTMTYKAIKILKNGTVFLYLQFRRAYSQNVRRM